MDFVAQSLRTTRQAISNLSGPTPKRPNLLAFPGGGGEDRTPDLLNAIQALSQLSYTPREHQSEGFVTERWDLVNCRAERRPTHAASNPVPAPARPSCP